MESLTTSTTDDMLMEKGGLLELQTLPTGASAPEHEYRTSSTKKLVFLAVYCALNLGLTLSNKFVMQRAKLPWLLTVMHAATTSLGCFSLVATGHLKPSKLSATEHLVLVAFSSLFTLNIAISNVSLALVSVPFHQVLRSTCPIATILIYRVAYKRSYEQQTYLSMIPIIIGVGMATVGDYYFTVLGFGLTLLGVLLAAVKTVASNRMMTGSLALAPLEILYRMSPLAAVQCLGYAAASGELSQLRTAYTDGVFQDGFLIALVVNAVMAFCLNVVSFQTNKVAGALTISVCGNVKQCLTILLGIILFNVHVSALNGIGMLITVGGAAWKTAGSNSFVNRHSLRELHLLLPATAANLNLCRLLLSGTIAGYPEPIFPGWDGHGLYDGAKSHLFKISETLAYLNTLPASRDEDLVLLLDAYDIWLLLPPEVIISRYEQMVKASDQRLREDDLYGQQIGGVEIRNSIFFGADKTCWPDDARRAACWAAAETPMRQKAFGPDTDSWMVPSRPRWLNSGTIIGPVKDMRDMFNGTMAMVHRVFDEDYKFRTSDQYYFQEVLGAQEIARMGLRDGGVQLPVLGRDPSNGSEIFGVVPNVPNGHRTEYHVTLDYQSEIFQTSAAYAEYLVWMSFNHSTETAQQPSGYRQRLDQLQLPQDVATAAPPFGKGFPADTVPGQYRWADMMLGVNMVTQTVFPVFHMTGDKSLRDKWWPRLWHHPYGKALLSASKEYADTNIVANVNGVKWTGATVVRNGSLPGTTRGGAWSDQGLHLKWDDLCAVHEDELFAA
ncbi:hypothetical protein LTR36_005031 [Oleoguttula mirabilis]|uniref:Sugar phosphate transporter domain-containing protein n=1 Tax=Oleoguttula mirabilis TaxID=1507867 RepID=A0AAV9JYL6_9PEZI|nr:hypothetical protein LTR36_005031 [Oleoguttula mirabilis]